MDLKSQIVCGDSDKNKSQTEPNLVKQEIVEFDVLKVKTESLFELDATAAKQEVSAAFEKVEPTITVEGIIKTEYIPLPKKGINSLTPYFEGNDYHSELHKAVLDSASECFEVNLIKEIPNEDFCPDNLSHQLKLEIKNETCEKQIFQQPSIPDLGRKRRDKSSRKKKIPCDICLKLYSSKRSLREHKRKYHSGKPKETYTCSVCSKTFTQKANLTSHERVHSKTREKFSCDFCDKGFGEI